MQPYIAIAKLSLSYRHASNQKRRVKMRRTVVRMRRVKRKITMKKGIAPR